MDKIRGRRVIASTIGGALAGRFVADLLGAPAWVGGAIGAAAPVAQATGATGALPAVAQKAVAVLAYPGSAIGRAMYPDGLTLPAPHPADTDTEP